MEQTNRGQENRRMPTMFLIDNERTVIFSGHNGGESNRKYLMDKGYKPGDRFVVEALEVHSWSSTVFVHPESNPDVVLQCNSCLFTEIQDYEDFYKK